jgi:hypothetical protein
MGGKNRCSAGRCLGQDASGIPAGAAATIDPEIGARFMERNEAFNLQAKVSAKEAVLF